MFTDTLHLRIRNAFMDTSPDNFMNRACQGESMIDIRPVPALEGKSALESAFCKNANLTFASSLRVSLGLDPFLAVAAEKTMLDQAWMAAEVTRQQVLFQQRKNELLLRLIAQNKQASLNTFDRSKCVPEIIDCSDESISPSERDDESGSLSREGSPLSYNSDDAQDTNKSSNGTDKLMPNLQTENSLGTLPVKYQEKRGFRPDQERKWKCHFKDFLKFVKKNGHGAVPHSYPKNQSLGQWVKRQRRQYKLHKDGQKSTLTEDRMELLSSAGFIFESHEVTWRERFEALKKYREEYGDCNVPVRYSKDKLGVWVKYQRRHYKLYLDGKPSSINEQRIEELEKLDFDWQLRQVFSDDRRHKAS